VPCELAALVEHSNARPRKRLTRAMACIRWWPDGFRMIRGVSIDHNVQRFRRHVDLMVEQDRRTQSGRRFSMKLRRMRRGQA